MNFPLKCLFLGFSRVSIAIFDYWRVRTAYTNRVIHYLSKSQTLIIIKGDAMTLEEDLAHLSNQHVFKSLIVAS
jgi:hypothetical protein